MFTGIVEEVGVVDSAGDRLVVSAPKVSSDSEVGSSVAVSGVCLTVVDRDGDRLAFDVSSETLRRSSLGRLRAGARVNLERSVTLLTRLGGHLVQGHVDGVGEVAAMTPEPDRGARLMVTVPDALRRFMVEKGPVALDGVSLTVASLDGDRFEVALVPFTLEATTLGAAAPGAEVNLEVDVIAKYVEGLTRRTA
jgi:riboflavin synthase